MAEEGSLTKKTGIVVFARIANTLVEIAVVISVIQLLSKPAFAVIGYLLMVHEIVRNLATLGFPESIFYYFERITRSAQKAFVVQTGAILLVMAVLAGGIIGGLSLVVPHFLVHWSQSSIASVQYLLPFMGLVTMFEIPVWPVTNILLATNRQKQAAWYEMTTTLLNFFCLVLPLLLGYSLSVAIYGLVVYAVIRFVGSVIWMHIILPGEVSHEAEISIQNQFNFSMPLGASAMVSKVNQYVDKIIVSLLLPALAYANYTLGAQEVPVIRVIPFAVGSVLISRYVSLELQSKKKELLQLWYKGIKKVSLLVLPLTILTIIIAPDLISLIAESRNASYIGAVVPFQIYNLIVLLRVTNYGSILQAFGDTKGVLYLSVLLVVTNVALSIPLTIWLGITGTALSTLLANVINWAVTLRRIGGHMNIKATNVLPFNYYFRVLGTAAAIGATVWLSRAYFIGANQTIEGLIWSISLFLMFFGLIGTAIGIIKRKDWNDLKNWLSLRFLR